MKRLITMLLSVLSIYTLSIQSLPIDRVILGCDLNHEYIGLWPLVAKAWHQIVGVRPVLALIAPAHIYVDESMGDVIRFEPIPGIPTHTQAQLIRLLVPTLFPEQGCLISDMDMLPCSRSYFIDSVASVPDTCFVVYRDRAYPEHSQHYPMCYIAAKGKVFSELLGVYSQSDFAQTMRHWYGQGFGWHTDEKVLFNALAQWPEASHRLVKLGHSSPPRIDRGSWYYNPQWAKAGYYVDAHLLKPYYRYYKEIDALADTLSLNHRYQPVHDLPQVRHQPLSDAGSYILPLWNVFMHTQGPVLEMGTDALATPLLHAWCATAQRFLGTAQTDSIQLGFFSHLATPTHPFWLIMTPEYSQEQFPTLDKWDNVYRNYFWSIVIMNHVPHERHVHDIQKMRTYTGVFVLVNPDEQARALAYSFASVYCFQRYEQEVLVISDQVNVHEWFA